MDQQEQVDLDELLRRHWGAGASFRDGQREAVEAVLRGDNAFVIMPTGGGKSLCYQLAALAMAPKTCIVITPLIALMQDQVASLQRRDVSACYLGSAQTDTLVPSTCFEPGKHSLVYMSPEYALAWGALPPAEDVSLVVVDEAHCICEWGGEFRPEYSELGSRLLPRFRGVPVMALTASATPEMQRRIAQNLWPPGAGAIRDVRYVRRSFARPNLSVRTVLCAVKAPSRKRALGADAPAMDPELGRLLLHCRGNRPLVVYANTRKDVDRIHGACAAHGIGAAKYHAGMAPEERLAAHEAFLADLAEVMVATTAYGMGIDKPNIRTILHWGMPSSLETYYQQIGRAGRDGRPSECVMLYSGQDDDITMHAWLAGRAEHSPGVNAVVAFCATASCKHAALLRHFGEAAPEHCGGACSSCSTSAPGAAPAPEDLALLTRVVARTGGCYSSKHVIKLLRGELPGKEGRAWKARLAEGDYGAGQRRARVYWPRLIHSAVEQGRVSYCFVSPRGRDNARFAALRLGGTPADGV